MTARFGMMHGRFQPFHHGHWEYLQLAAPRCQTLLIGITNPDPAQVAEEGSSGHRHLAESNPFTYFDRLRMIRATLQDAEMDLSRIMIVPFPINFPERMRYYVPPEVVHYLRVFSAWEQAKVDRLRAAGYRVEVLDPGGTKGVEASEVRRRMGAGEAWEELVPDGVARVIHDLQEGGGG